MIPKGHHVWLTELSNGKFIINYPVKPEGEEDYKAALTEAKTLDEALEKIRELFESEEVS